MRFVKYTAYDTIFDNGHIKNSLCFEYKESEVTPLRFNCNSLLLFYFDVVGYIFLHIIFQMNNNLNPNDNFPFACSSYIHPLR